MIQLYSAADSGASASVASTASPRAARHTRPAQHPRRAPSLHADATALYHAMTALLRSYQNRDRHATGYHGLSITHSYMFEALTRLGPITLSALAAEMHLEKSTLSRAVDDLAAKGFLTRRRNAADGRSVLLAPTVRGLRHYRLLQRDRIAANARVLGPIRAPVRRELLRLIDAMTAEVRSRALDRILPN